MMDCPYFQTLLFPERCKETYFPFEVVFHCQAQELSVSVLPSYFQEVGHLYQLNICQEKYPDNQRTETNVEVSDVAEYCMH